MERFLKLLDPADVKGGLWRLIVASIVVMTVLRAGLHPGQVVFHVGQTGDMDYASMIWMSSWLIAIDAMVLVVLSWSHLRDWKDAVGVASLVGLTHVFFPLLTFGVTAGTALATEALGLPTMLAGGSQTAIYFVAFAFVARHLVEVHGAARDGEAEFLRPDAPVATWLGVKQIFPAVFAVSVDALMVGPAKVAFMARYTTEQFLLSFVYIGASVFALVFTSGLVVLALKATIDSHVAIARRVHQLDWLGSLALVCVFIHFSVFAGVYVMYTFTEAEWLLETVTIWTSTAVFFFLYLFFGKVGEIKTASRLRAGVSD